MKIFPPDLQTLFDSGEPYLMAECLLFRAPVLGSYLSGLYGDIFLAITNADVDLLITPDADIPTNCTFDGFYPPRGFPPASYPQNRPAGSVYCSAFPFDRVKISLTCGLGVNELDLKLYPPESATISGSNFSWAIRSGVFDGASVDIMRVYWSVPTGIPPSSYGGGVIVFAGRVSESDIGLSSVDMKISDFTELLNLNMPRNVYQSFCPFLLYGPGCAANKVSNTFSGTIAANPGPASFNISGVSKPSGYFSMGVFTFTSGVLEGFSGTIKSHVGNSITPIQVLPELPVSGDGITLYAGCDRTWTTCQTKFSNGAHFGGQPYIPIPDTMLPPIVQTASGAGK